MQYTWKTAKFTRIYAYAASTSGRIHTNARTLARKLGVTSATGCTFADEITRGVKAVWPSVAGIFACNCVFLPSFADFLPTIAGFLPANVGIFTRDCGYYCLRLQVILLAISGIFA